MLYGNVDIRQVQLAFQSEGRVAALHVQEGDAVRAGQLIAELDPVRYQDAVDQATAQAAAQEQVLAALEAGSRPEEIAEAEAQARAAEAELIKAQQHRDRLEALRKEQFVSQQDLDDAKNDMNAAAANLDAAQQAAKLAVKGPRQEDIESAREQLKAYEAALRLAQRELHDTRLYAPTNGIIQNRILEPGDMAAASVPVFSLALQDPVWVRAYIPEPDLGRILYAVKRTGRGGRRLKSADGEKMTTCE
jgi:HlyD family secretion protein